MSACRSPLLVLVAEDDPDDQILIKEAFKENQLMGGLCFVNDGEELLDYLNHKGRYSDMERSPRPSLILLDLNMPKKDGRQALREIKEDSKLKEIPVIVFTTSKEEEDVVCSYRGGAASYITKPFEFEGLVKAVGMIKDYWFKIVLLPKGEA